VVTRRVWIESFDRFVHFLYLISSPLLADVLVVVVVVVVVVVLAMSQLTELGWRQEIQFSNIPLCPHLVSRDSLCSLGINLGFEKSL
jgi:hypothetical protein